MSGCGNSSAQHAPETVLDPARQNRWRSESWDYRRRLGHRADASHPAAAQSLDQGVTIKDLLSAAKVADGCVDFATHGAILTTPRNSLKQKIGRQTMERGRPAPESLPVQDKRDA